MKNIKKILRSPTIKDSIIISIGLGVTAISGFIYTVILARNFGPEGFGIYSAITALAAIVYSLGDLGISPSMINFIPKDTKNAPKFLTAGFWLQFFVAIVTLLIFVLFSKSPQAIVPGSTARGLLLAGAMSVNYLFINFAQGIFTAERRFWSYSLSQTFDPLIKLTIVFLLLHTSDLSIESAIGANFISTILSLLITFWRELYRTELEVNLQIISKIINFAKWIAASRIFSVLISKIDIIILNSISGNYQAGIYSAASRVAVFYALLVSALSSVTTSRFSAFTSTNQVLSYSRKVAFISLAVCLSMIFCAVFSDSIISLVYGTGYLEAVVVFRLLMVAMLPFPFVLITIPAIIYTYNLPSFYAKLTMIQVVLLIILEILLTPRLNYFSPVIATAVTNILVLLVSGWKLLNLIHQKTLEKRLSNKSVLHQVS